MLLTAYVIYDGTTSRYVGDNNPTIQINCERLNAFSPRPVWLRRELAPGDGTAIIYTPTFFVSSVELADVNTLQGFWIEQDGKSAIIDIPTAATLVAGCDACCDDAPIALTRFYTSGIPSFTPLTSNTFCITRSDDGTTISHGAVALDYIGQIFGNPIRTSWVSGVSKYQVTSFYTLTQIVKRGTDTIASGVCS